MERMKNMKRFSMEIQNDVEGKNSIWLNSERSLPLCKVQMTMWTTMRTGNVCTD
jgi:hypothetical protein